MTREGGEGRRVQFEDDGNIMTADDVESRRIRFENDDHVFNADRQVHFENDVSSGDISTSPKPVKHSHWQTYWRAIRPWSFTASVCPVLLGSALAYRASNGLWSPLLLVSCLLTALAVHAAGNLVNTYFDYSLGVDSPVWCDDRTLVDSLLTPGEVELMATVLYALGTGAFVVTVLGNGGRAAFVLTIIFVLGMSGSFFYTGGGPLALKYRALGEILVFMVFGPVTVAFSFLGQLKVDYEPEKWFWLPLLYALPVALNTVAILHANNMRDAHNESDRLVTVAIMLGPGLARFLLGLLLLAPYIVFTVLALHSSAFYLLPCVSIGEALKLVRVAAKVRTGKEDCLRRLPQKIAKLNLILGALHTVSVLIVPQRVFTV